MQNERKLALMDPPDKKELFKTQLSAYGLLNHQAVSICYLMRKLKCTESKAKEIVESLEEHT